jgi:hypothetical protein
MFVLISLNIHDICRDILNTWELNSGKMLSAMLLAFCIHLLTCFVNLPLSGIGSLVLDMRWTSDVSRYSVETCAVHLMISCPLLKCIGFSVVTMNRKLNCRESGNELYSRISGTPTWNNGKWHIETSFSKTRRVVLSFHVSLIKILGHNTGVLIRP